ncbi:VOC family protein [Sphingobacterium sp. Mn56C]|uniref:VOC family protein n=1 Tax=Sphingobacterium sp. Mn56C TaxID=3395261 RepID=UPI003BC22DE7
MIEGFSKAHIQVNTLGTAVQFYTKIMGLQLAHYDETWPIAFLWIGENKKAMLGLWEHPENLQKRYFAFRCSKDFILESANTFLQERELKA